MKTIGIISEYNPFHMGHAHHIGETRRLAGGECAIVCVMSGNFVQRGDFAVFGKHARAEAAVRGGADLVIELPTPYALLSAEGFAASAVSLLENLGVCGALSFGSESGSIEELAEAAEAIASPQAGKALKEWLDKGLPYAAAQQKAADATMGKKAGIFGSPNNLLGVEYLKALRATGSKMRPMTVGRRGGAHDGGSGFSASAVREKLFSGKASGKPQRGRGGADNGGADYAWADNAGTDYAWDAVPKPCAAVFDAEIRAGRGPVSMDAAELAILSRLRALDDLSRLPGATEGLDRRMMGYIASEATVPGLLAGVKTKRYSMSRLRRMLLCACLGIDADDTKQPPPYIRVLAMNDAGTKILKAARKKATLPIITKPASVKKLSGRAVELFTKEVRATDFYVLAYPDAGARSGGQEWRISPGTYYATPR